MSTGQLAAPRSATPRRRRSDVNGATDVNDRPAQEQADHGPLRAGGEPPAPPQGMPRLRLAVAVVALGLLSGCVNGSEPDQTARDASIYRSVIIDVADGSGIAVDSAEDVPVLFIESIGPDQIPLPIQADIVASLVERYEIRFIDNQDEAVEVDLPGSPVRPGSLLIGLGPIDIEGTAEVRSELYLSVDEVDGFRYTLVAAADDVWNVAGSPEPIEPEGLVPRS